MIMKVLLLLLGLVVFMAIPAHTWKPLDLGTKNDSDTSNMLKRLSSQDTHQYSRALRNYILRGYLNPSGQGISRQLRGGSVKEKCKKAGEVCKRAKDNFLKLIKPKKYKPIKENYHYSDPTDYGFLPDLNDNVSLPDQTDFGNENNWMKCKKIAHNEVTKKNLRVVRDNILHETGYCKPPGIKLFDDFKITFNKKYENEAEKGYRNTLFQKNVQEIEDHNMLYKLGERSYMKQVTIWSDRTKEEFMKNDVGCVRKPNIAAKVDSTYKEKRSNVAKVYIPEKVGEEPEYIDYRQCGAINPIRNQGGCGSCWAFSVISTIESQIFLKYKKQYHISEQEMIDCSPGNCIDGGDTAKTIQYYVGKGIALRDSYKYTAKDGQCDKDAPKAGYKVSAMLYFKPTNDADLLNALVHKGPISVLIYTSWNFEHYREGVLDDELCTKDSIVDHAVTLIGYGTTESGKKYWLLRNSHGEKMGEGGYFKLARDKVNHCRISDYASIPEIQ